VHQLQEVWSWIALDVELDASFQRSQMRGDIINVCRRDVPGIGTWMDRDARCPCIDADAHRAEY
jgi:hypothetical protein